MAFDITKYLEENKIELGSIKKEVGTSISKSGHNDLRKTTYDVKIKDGKFDLSTHKSIMTEANIDSTDSLATKRSEVPKINVILDVKEQTKTSRYLVAKFFRKGDAIIAMDALNKQSPKNYKYSIEK